MIKSTALLDLTRKLQTDPAFHTLEYVEDKFVRELEGVKDSILKAILKENQQTEQVIRDNIKTYASVATAQNKNSLSFAAPSTNNTNLKEAVK